MRLLLAFNEPKHGDRAMKRETHRDLLEQAWQDLNIGSRGGVDKYWAPGLVDGVLSDDLNNPANWKARLPDMSQGELAARFRAIFGATHEDQETHT